MIFDCNKCAKNSLTESEQKEARTRTGLHWPHYCGVYHTQLFHRTQNRDHDSYIYPCSECMNDGYKNYTERKDINEQRTEHRPL